MADYKRFVSYMYEYVNGVKKKNVGYARVEIRNGECKFTIYMQMEGQMEGIFPTYLIHRPADEMELVYLGDCIVKNQVMSSKLLAKESNVMDTGYKFSDMGGILLFLNSGVFYATQWDDKPILLDEVLEALKPKSKEPPIDIKSVSEQDDITVISQKKISASKEETKEKTKEEVPKLADTEEITFKDREADTKETTSKDREAVTKETTSKGREADTEEKTLEDKPSDMKAKSPEKKPIDASVYQQIDIAKKVSGDQKPITESKKSDSQIPIYMLPRGWKAKEGAGPIGSEKPINPWEQVDRYKSFETENKKSTDGLAKVRSHPGINEIQKENQSIEKIFNNYPRIYPFEDNEIKRCVKIEPKDIGALPSGAWILSNNSFLLHGYYCYHHLIFAELIDRYGSRYILGVPGIYHNRERFMARMFGFERFKSIRKRELKQGDFGYWYQEVKP